MWIKTQDGSSLLNCKGFQVGGNDVYGINPEGNESSIVFMLIGSYGSVKEAHSILEKIEEHINSGKSTIFYMPPYER